MPQIVHVIGPKGSDRHEERLPDGWTPAQLLAEVRKRQIGYGQFQGKYLLDYPETVVAVGRCENKQFVETARLHGPTVEPTTPAA